MIAADGLVSCANSLQEGYQSQTILVLTGSWLPHADTFVQDKQCKCSELRVLCA